MANPDKVARNCEAILHSVDRMLAESTSTLIDAELAAVRELAKELLEPEPDPIPLPESKVERELPSWWQS